MRFMDIPLFPRRIEIPDFDSFIRGRLSQKVTYWPQQAIPLVGYMAWPNDPAGRHEATRILRKWVQNTRETGFKKTQGPIFGARSIQKAPRNHDKSSRLCPTLVWYTGCLRLMRAPTGANGCELEFGHILKFRAPTMGIREGVLP